MMSNFQQYSYFALRCDEHGIILEILHDSFNMENARPGLPIGQIVDSGSQNKTLNFLIELKKNNAVYDWEVIIPNQGQSVLYRLSGVVDKNGLIVIGVSTSNDTLKILEELLIINSEQINMLRSVVKAKLENESKSIPDDIYLFDEISRLNNELVALQRDLAKKNAELEKLYAIVQKQAVIDTLTGIYNRRGFFELGQREVERSKRYNHPLAAIMFDCDRFKDVNDQYGHAAGDRVLEIISERCLKQLRSVDIFGRYGGDEFVVLLPDTSLENGHIVAERLLKACRVPINIPEAELNVTISLGVTILKDESYDLDDLLKNADRALYKAKEMGRNCISISQN